MDRTDYYFLDKNTAANAILTFLKELLIRNVKCPNIKIKTMLTKVELEKRSILI